jgi:hypothetical protein
VDDGERQAGRHAFEDYPQRDTGRPIQEPSLPSPAAPVRTILRLRAVRISRSRSWPSAYGPSTWTAERSRYPIAALVSGAAIQ